MIVPTGISCVETKTIVYHNGLLLHPVYSTHLYRVSVYHMFLTERTEDLISGVPYGYIPATKSNTQNMHV